MVSFFEGKDNILLSSMFPTKPCTDSGTWCLLMKELLKDWSSESTQEQLPCAVSFYWASLVAQQIFITSQIPRQPHIHLCPLLFPWCLPPLPLQHWTIFRSPNKPRGSTLTCLYRAIPPTCISLLPLLLFHPPVFLFSPSWVTSTHPWRLIASNIFGYILLFKVPRWQWTNMWIVIVSGYWDEG